MPCGSCVSDRVACRRGVACGARVRHQRVTLRGRGMGSRAVLQLSFICIFTKNLALVGCLGFSRGSACPPMGGGWHRSTTHGRRWWLNARPCQASISLRHQAPNDNKVRPIPAAQRAP
eukprot:scaffold5479_cov131-Isochrysis_galbana.AAC.1